MEVARWQQQQRVPAFGEWKYSQYDYGIDGCTPLTPCFDVVAVQMSNTRPAPKPSNERARTRGNARHRRIPAFGEWNDDGDSSWPAAATQVFDLAAAHKPPETQRKSGDGGLTEAKRRSAEPYGRRRSKVADSEAHAARKSCFTVVVPKPADDDLYRVPSDIFYQKPARKRGWLRFLLVAGCICPGRINTA